MAANPQEQFPNNAPYMRPVSANVLNPEIQREIRQNNPRNKKRVSKVSKIQKAIRTAVRVVIVAMLAGFTVSVVKISLEIRSVQNQINDAKTTYKKVKKNNAELNLQNKNLKNPEYLESVLRDKYRYTKDGEVLFNIPTTK
ncbi:MAG: septum formation initiator family protein [Lactobacillaceae bacterium]|jgi:cell division protein DivIC|nr:septum formation initiator family protein [Lactobacillaceae bacterium]